MERANDEEEHPHDISVATEHLGKGQSDFWLNFVLINSGCVKNLEEDEGEGNNGENEEEEENVVAIEEVIGLIGGVIEPEGLGEGEIPAKRRLGFVEGLKRQHWGAAEENPDGIYAAGGGRSGQKG